MTLKAILPAVFALSLGATGVALAQTTTTHPTAPTTGHTAPVVSGSGSATNNAVNTKANNNAGAPVSGANSFTESQARDRIQAKGFSEVTGLKLDGQGVWRGKGTRNGQTTDVSLDYQGNVVPQ